MRRVEIVIMENVGEISTIKLYDSARTQIIPMFQFQVTFEVVDLHHFHVEY